MKILALFSCLLVSVMSYSDESTSVIDKLSGSWVVKIQNLKRNVVTEMTIRFSEEKADSCLGGNWKKITLESQLSSDEKFFPTTEPMSYQFENDKMVIGRNQVCDGYLHLTGSFIDEKAEGEYISFGWGTRTLGYFSMSRKNES